MANYDFQCEPCLKRGIVSIWEMSFGIHEEPKIAFCPKCGKQGKQVILQAPSLNFKSTSMKRIDTLIKDGLEERGQTDIRPPRQREEPEVTELRQHIAGNFAGMNGADAVSKARNMQAQSGIPRESRDTLGFGQVQKVFHRPRPSSKVIHPEDAKT